MRSRLTATTALAAAALMAGGAQAQQYGAARHSLAPTEPLSGNQPVTFQADRVSYDKEHGLIIASGHVEAWQNDHILRADEVTFDRNTNVAAAYGHVVLAEPDGQVVFADYAELSQGMKAGVLTGLRALLADNGRLAANGARRVDGKLNEMSRGVYSTCNLCALDPGAPLMWQIEASHLTQDLEHKRIEYTDAWLKFYGYPVFYLPYFSNTDPSEKRQSGFLVPDIGLDKHLGTFFDVPYYMVLNRASDLTLTPMVATKTGPQLAVNYRLDLDNGIFRANGAIADDQHSLQGYIFTHGAFSWDDNWRYGFEGNIASSINYMRDFRIPGYGANVIGSDGYIEGFGVGSYARLDMRAYQALNSSVSQVTLPYVLPSYQYSFFGEPNLWGGRFSLDANSFNVVRDQGTNDQRLAGRLQWDRPFSGMFGDRWLVTAQVSGAFYNANDLNAQPNYGEAGASTTAHAQPQLAVRLNWPFLRDGGRLGSQILEPILQVIGAPNSGNAVHDRLPNEDSLDYEFTDSTLFALNRFGGYDRYDGGTRVNYALHASWIFPGGQVLDGLIGQSWQEHIDSNLYPEFQPWNGFRTGSHTSDVISRVRFTPSTWFNFTARARFDETNGDVRTADAVAGFGAPILHVGLGYFYGWTNPYGLYLFNYNQKGVLSPNNQFINFFDPRNEASISVGTRVGHWSATIDARRDLATNRMVSLGVDAKYENECTIFDILATRRYTSINFDQGDTTILFTLTLKTVGQIGFNG